MAETYLFLTTVHLLAAFLVKLILIHGLTEVLVFVIHSLPPFPFHLKKWIQCLTSVTTEPKYKANKSLLGPRWTGNESPLCPFVMRHLSMTVNLSNLSCETWCQIFSTLDTLVNYIWPSICWWSVMISFLGVYQKSFWPILHCFETFLSTVPVQQAIHDIMDLPHFGSITMRNHNSIDWLHYGTIS